MKKTLHLNLKRKWFEMIKSGEKKEEYREITPYWCARLLYRIEAPSGGYLSSMRDILKGNYDCKSWTKNGGPPIFTENYDSTTFSNGYAKDRGQFENKLKGISIGEGKPDWGAIPGKKYFVLELGEIL